jgi:hypothetical protein
MKLQLEIYINPDWITIPYVSDDISLLLKRDNENDLIIRTTCDGDFIFSCKEYPTLLNYINTYNDLEARITETDCDSNTQVYTGYLRLDDEVDYFVNEVKGKFVLNDTYYNYFERPDVNGQKEYDLYNFMPFNSGFLSFINKYIYFEITADSTLSRAVSQKAFRFGDIIGAFVENIFNPTLDVAGVQYNGSDLDDLVFIKSDDWYKNNDRDYIFILNDDTFNLSFSTILNALQSQLFYSWYIKDNIFYLEKRKDFGLTQGEYLTAYETAKSQFIKFDDKKITSYEITTKEANEMSSNEIYHANGRIDFFKSEANPKKIPANINTNPLNFEGNGFFLIKTNDWTSGNFNLRNINANWSNEDGKINYFLGNWNELEFTKFPFDGAIVSDYFTTPANQIFTSINFTFEYNDAASYTTGDLKLIFFTDPFVPANDVIFDIAAGGNSFNVAGKDFNGIIRIVNSVGTDVSPVSISKIKLFELNIDGNNYVEDVEINTISGVNSPNYYLSNHYILTNQASNMARNSGTLVMKDIIDASVTCHVKNDMFKEMEIPKTDLISNIDFNQEPDTKNGYMRVDSVERIYRDYQDYTTYNLSKKY